MPRKSQPGNRSFGLTGAGKGDKSRVTDVPAYRQNYDAINWHRPGEVMLPTQPCKRSPWVDLIAEKPKSKTLREIEEAHEWRLEVAPSEHDWRMGL